MRLLTKKRTDRGFTLVEIMIVVAIIGLLVALSMPSLLRARQSSEAARIAKDLKVFGDAFQMYYAATGRFPIDTDIVLPASMVTYIHAGAWSRQAWGGNFNWEGPSWGEGGPYTYAGISIDNTTATNSQLTSLDAVLDDGNINTGIFRQTPNGRYTYILAE